MTKLLKFSALMLSALVLLASCGTSDIDGDSDAPASSAESEVSDVLQDELGSMYGVVKDLGGQDAFLGISFCENGTGFYSTSAFSSTDTYFKWTRDGDLLCIEDDNGGGKYYFKVKENSIAYIAEDSDPFGTLNLKDGDELPVYPVTLSGELYKPKGVMFARKNDNGFDSFTITLFENGTFSYYETCISSHIGMGFWTLDGDTVCMRERRFSNPYTYEFKYENGKLLYIADGSDKFMFAKLQDGAEFTASADDLPELPSGKSYCRQDESLKDFPSFFITILEDGNFTYYNGTHVGSGKWTLDGDIYCLTDNHWYEKVYKFYFRKDGDNLVYISEKSDEFPLEKLKRDEVLYLEH